MYPKNPQESKNHIIFDLAWKPRELRAGSWKSVLGNGAKTTHVEKSRTKLIMPLEDLPTKHTVHDFHDDVLVIKIDVSEKCQQLSSKSPKLALKYARG